MDWQAFWQIVSETDRTDSIERFEALQERLKSLKWFEVVEFQAKFDEALAGANTHALRGAAVLINGDRSENAFKDFRVWLVGRGQRVYDAALANPDSLADLLAGDPVDGFGLNRAALLAYESLTGMSDFYERLEKAVQDNSTPPPAGDGFEWDDPVQLLSGYPMLFLLYPQLPNEA